MNHSDCFEKAKAEFLAGHWNATMIQFLVTKGLLTQAEYDEIVG